MCFEWKPNNLEIFEFRNAANNQVFIGPFFEMYSFKWYLKFIPFIKIKDNYSNTKENYCRLYICLASKLLPNISNISCYIKLTMIEKNMVESTIFHFNDKNTEYGWYEEAMKRNEMINLNKITFQVSIHMFEVYDKDENIITDQYVDDSKTQQDCIMVNSIQHPLDAKDDYVWKIINFEDSIDSPLFDHPLGFKFYLRLLVNDKYEIYICLKSLPKHIDELSLYYYLLIQENNYNARDTMNVSQSKLPLQILVGNINCFDLNKITFRIYLKNIVIETHSIKCHSSTSH
eukprot:134372_1